MKEVYHRLEQGNAASAMERFAGAVKSRPEDAPALAEKMAELLAVLYKQLNVAPVQEFYRLAEDALPPDVQSIIREKIGGRIERTDHWINELRLVRQERLIREARTAITNNDPERAAELGRQLLTEARSRQEINQWAKQYVHGLAEMVHDKDRGKKAIRLFTEKAKELGIKDDLGLLFDQAASQAARAGFQESDRAWTRMVNQATVTILNFLPGQRETGDPSDEAVAAFSEEMMAIVRAASVSAQPQGLIDALGMIKEFSPTDPQTHTSLGGAEPRIFLQLGNKAKLISVRALQQIGEMPVVRKHVTDLAESAEGQPRIGLLAPAMGGLRHTDFTPWLSKALERVKTPANEALVIEALGRIGSPEAIDLILARLKNAMNVRIFDPAKIRYARMLITSLGRIARSRFTEAPDRKRLVHQAVKTVGDRETAISWFAADQLFALRLDELDEADRKWAVRQLMRAMFMKDSGHNPPVTSPLGFRAPIANALIRIGKPLLDDVVEAAQPHAGNYSGGFLAFAEVMEKIGDERAVPVLESMLRTAFLFNDQRQGGLLEEKVFDAAAGEQRPLSRDTVVHALLFALDKIGGKEGEAAILRIADQVQSGQIAPPGPESGTFLGRYKRERGLVGELSDQAAANFEAPSMPDREIEEAMEQARGGLFAKAAKRVPAIATLGRSKRPDVAPVLIRCLGDKDQLVHSAAETALNQFLHPTPRPELFEQFVAGLVSDPKAIKGDALDRLQTMVERNFPKRDPYSQIFRQQVARFLGDSPESFRLISAMKKVPDPTGGSAPAPEESAETGANGGAKPAPGGRRLLDPEIPENSKLAALDRKREYLEKRRAWIAAGKHGPPPEPPD